jgi:hypothetical protein
MGYRLATLDTVEGTAEYLSRDVEATAASFRGAPKARAGNPERHMSALLWIPGPALGTVPE